MQLLKVHSPLLLQSNSFSQVHFLKILCLSVQRVIIFLILLLPFLFNRAPTPIKEKRRPSRRGEKQDKSSFCESIEVVTMKQDAALLYNLWIFPLRSFQDDKRETTKIPRNRFGIFNFQDDKRRIYGSRNWMRLQISSCKSCIRFLDCARKDLVFEISNLRTHDTN